MRFLKWLTTRSRLNRLDLFVMCVYIGIINTTEHTGWNIAFILLSWFVVTFISTIVEYELHPEQSKRR